LLRKRHDWRLGTNVEFIEVEYFEAKVKEKTEVQFGSDPSIKKDKLIVILIKEILHGKLMWFMLVS
jgi:hypothetical protein